MEDASRFLITRDLAPTLVILNSSATPQPHPQCAYNSRCNSELTGNFRLFGSGPSAPTVAAPAAFLFALIFGLLEQYTWSTAGPPRTYSFWSTANGLSCLSTAIGRFSGDAPDNTEELKFSIRGSLEVNLCNILPELPE